MKLLGSAIVAVAAAWPSLATGQSNPPDYKIEWQSTNASQSELSIEFAGLYRGLITLIDKDAALPTRTITDPLGRPVAQIAKAEHLYAGAFFPSELDELICRLNAHRCQAIIGLDGKTRNFLWTNRPGDTITLPDLSLQAVTVPAPYLKKKGDTLKSIVVDDRLGCAALDEACERYLQNLNRLNPDALQSWYEGEILVPTQSYRAEIKLARKPKFDLDLLKDGSKTPLLHYENLEPSEARLLDKFKRSIVPENSLYVESEPDSDVTNATSLLRELIHAPDTIDMKFVAPVAIFDRAIDIRHCQFHKGVTLIKADEAGVARLNDAGSVTKWEDQQIPEDAPCGEMAQASIARDHGTHVLGLITGRDTSVLGTEAALKMQVFGYELPNADLNQPSDVLTLFDTVNGSLMDAVILVYNFSATYSVTGNGNNDVLERLITSLSLHSNMLFVTAAGNNAREFNARTICDRRPPCIASPNVLSVVALDLSKDSPGITPGSNHGDAFDLGVPGADLESAISSNNFGKLTGTSQATAVASAAAAALYGRERDLPPWKVRNRLIYTSDFFPSLETKVIGGRLNLSRALDFDEAILRHAQVGIPGDLRGKLLLPDRPLKLLDVSANQEIDVKRGHLLRLSTQGPGLPLIAFIREGSGEPEIIRRAKVLPGDGAGVSMEVSAPAALRGQVIDIPLSMIVDFTAAM